MPLSLSLENRLLLACARTDPDLDGIGALVERGPDWQPIARKAEHWGISSLVYASLRPLVSAEQVPAPVAEQLRRRYRQDTTNSVGQRELLRVTLLRFREEGIPVIVLEAAALATLVYSTPALRPIGSIDLLIHPRDRQGAAQILRDLEADHPNIPYLGPRGFDLLTLHEQIAARVAPGLPRGSQSAPRSQRKEHLLPSRPGVRLVFIFAANTGGMGLSDLLDIVVFFTHWVEHSRRSNNEWSQRCPSFV